MLDLAAAVLARLDAGRRVAVATVVRVRGSGPRTVGSSMLVDEDGQVVGSISGGCVEGEVHDVAGQVLADGAARLEEYGISDETAFSVGLSCGGELTVQVREVGEGEADALRAAVDGATTSSAVILEGPAALAGMPVARLTDALLREHGVRSVAADRIRSLAAAQAETGRNATVEVECLETRLSVFVETVLAPPSLLLFGAVEFSAALSRAAKALGYRVTLVDARPAFATPERFPHVDELVVRWPVDALAAMEVDERTVICVLGHDPKFDVPLLAHALRLPVAYVGAMGSRRTHERRTAALREAGLTDDELASLRSPIGLDLGASTPEETAISILAEVLAVRRKASGRPLRELDGPIHEPERGTGIRTS